jgi:septal ring factor EnvC (AmiA/AmiB activator)
MSPEKIVMDPVVAPMLMGAVVKIKDFVVMRALTATVVMAFSVGIFYSQTNAMLEKVDKFTSRLEKLETAMVILQRSQDIANNNVAHMRSDIDKITAQLGEMVTYRAKLRRK